LSVNNRDPQSCGFFLGCNLIAFPYMSHSARILGLTAAVLMGAFSAWMYVKTGDWVAAVFCLGSVAYFVLFTTGGAGKKSK